MKKLPFFVSTTRKTFSIGRTSFTITFVITIGFWLKALYLGTSSNTIPPSSLVDVLMALLAYELGKKFNYNWRCKNDLNKNSSEYKE